MRRATITFPDELERELEDYLAGKDAPPSLTTLVQAALRDYLRNERLKARDFQPAVKPFSPRPFEEKDDQGEPDVSINHDAYIGQP